MLRRKRTVADLVTNTRSTALGVRRRRRPMAGTALSALALTGGLAIGFGGTAGASPSAPSAPSGPTAAPGLGAAELTWTVGANGGSTITGFKVVVFHSGTQVGSGVVTAGAVGSPLDPTPGAVDTYNVGGQPGGVAATYAVTAINGTGTSSNSLMSAAVTPSSVATAPYAPSNVTVSSPGNFDATVHWIVPPNNGQSLTTFELTARRRASPPSPFRPAPSDFSARPHA